MTSTPTRSKNPSKWGRKPTHEAATLNRWQRRQLSRRRTRSCRSLGGRSRDWFYDYDQLSSAAALAFTLGLLRV